MHKVGISGSYGERHHAQSAITVRKLSSDEIIPEIGKPALFFLAAEEYCLTAGQKSMCEVKIAAELHEPFMLYAAGTRPH